MSAEATQSAVPAGAELAVEHRSGVAWLTLSRPDSLNSLDTGLKEALVATLAAAAGDPAVRAVALTGSGRGFCVGQDLRELSGVYRSGSSPDSKALEIALLGDWVEADEALRIGLVSRVFPAEELAARAEEVLATLASGPTLALARTKALLRSNLQVDLDRALEAEAQAQAASGQTKDHLEGVTAFLEKRPPRFQGA